MNKNHKNVEFILISIAVVVGISIFIFKTINNKATITTSSPIQNKSLKPKSKSTNNDVIVDDKRKTLALEPEPEEQLPTYEPIYEKDKSGNIIKVTHFKHVRNKLFDFDKKMLHFIKHYPDGKLIKTEVFNSTPWNDEELFSVFEYDKDGNINVISNYDSDGTYNGGFVLHHMNENDEAHYVEVDKNHNRVPKNWTTSIKDIKIIYSHIINLSQALFQSAFFISHNAYNL